MSWSKYFRGQKEERERERTKRKLAYYHESCSDPQLIEFWGRQAGKVDPSDDVDDQLSCGGPVTLGHTLYPTLKLLTRNNGHAASELCLSKGGISRS